MVSPSVPEIIEISKWDQLLTKLGISEREALEAIVVDGEIGRSIRRFVENSARNHFVPENALLAVNLYRKAPASVDEG